MLFSVSEDRAYHALTEVTESLFNRYVVIDIHTQKNLVLNGSKCAGLVQLNI